MAFPMAEILFLALAVSCCCAAGPSSANDDVSAERHGKFFAPVVTKTVTSISFTTTVVPTTVNPICFTSLSNITACAARRRRQLTIREQPFFLQILPNGVITPTQVHDIEATVIHDVESKSLHGTVALESSNQETVNLEQVQQAQAELGRFVANTVFTTTVITLPTFSLSTVAGKDTATISLVNCKPAGAKLTPAC